MIKKRLVGVITVRDGWGVQSVGYKKYYPLGNPMWLAENFDRWGVDEIFIQDISKSRNFEEPNFELIQKIGLLGLSTPIIYAGGISSLSHALKVIELGADRIAVDSLLHSNVSEVEVISQKLGSQAVIASIPVVLSTSKHELLHFDYSKEVAKQIQPPVLNLLVNSIVSEVFLIDPVNEGYFSGFNDLLVSKFPIASTPIIVFGGISSRQQINKLFSDERVVAIAMGNFLSYKEHAVQTVKSIVSKSSMRKPFFSKTL